MKLNQSCLLQAACCLILIVAATYATPTSSESKQNIQKPEVNARPLRRGSMKYGDTVVPNKAIQEGQFIAPTVSPARIKGANLRRGKPIETSVKNESVLGNVTPLQTNRSGERQLVRNPTIRGKVATSQERQQVRTEGNRSKEVRSDEHQPVRTERIRSKEATSDERPSVRTERILSKEATSDARPSARTERIRSKETTTEETTTEEAITEEASSEESSSEEASSEELQPAVSPLNNRSKEAITSDRQAVGTANTRSKEAIIPGRHLIRSDSKRSKEVVNSERLIHRTPPKRNEEVTTREHKPLRIQYDSSKELNPAPVATPTSASNDNTSPNQQRSRRRNQSSERNGQHVVNPLTSAEHITLPTIAPSSHVARRHNGAASTQNQIVMQQYDIPIVQKTHEAPYKPITSAVGHRQQQQKQQENPNQSRFSLEQQATRIYGNNQQQHISKTLTPTSTLRHQQQQPKQLQQQQHQQRLLVPTRTGGSSHQNSQDPILSSRNSNHNNFSSGRRNSAEIVSHSGSNSSNNQHRAASHENLNTAHFDGGSQQRNSATNVANGGPPHHLRKPSPSTTTAIATTTPRPFFSLPNQYNIFSSEFWQFLNPSYRANQHITTNAPIITTTTKRPPKKYVPPQQISSKEDKANYSKPKPTFQTQEPNNHLEYKENTTPIRKEDGPFRIALPTFNFLNPQKETNTESEKGKRDIDDEKDDIRAKFNCPRESEVRFQLFPKICKIDDDCKTWNRGEICCDIFGAKSCVTGVPKPLEEASHSPILGLIPRKCPNRPLAELWWEVKECETDMDCWPRVCCPDGRQRYCRTSQPELNTVPVPVKRSFNYLTEYLECTAPPPRIFDLHPKACTSTLDCFPNVCCQEAGLRHCRPPKKSVLTMLATVFNVDLVKRLTQNIVIK